MKFTYLHGFTSGPSSKKAKFFKQRFLEHGIELTIPDLNVPTFRQLTLTNQLNYVGEIIGGENDTVLFGSSMGGLVAALAATKWSSIKLLVLLAPGFGIERRWTDLIDTKKREQWKSTGAIEVFHYVTKKNEFLDYSFVEDLQNHSSRNIKVSVPTLILHGTNDFVVPISESYEFTRAHAAISELVALDDDHELLASLEQIWLHVDKFLSNYVGNVFQSSLNK